MVLADAIEAYPIPLSAAMSTEAQKETRSMIL